jgi:hypothetical protein
VSAAVEDWSNSGIEVSKGQTYQITATGKWRTYSACNFTEADGIGLYTALCFKNPLYPPVIAGYSHATLSGRIGTDNEPFVVGSNHTFKAEHDGILFFRSNDAVNANFDNEGFVGFGGTHALSFTQFHLENSKYSDTANLQAGGFAPLNHRCSAGLQRL